MNHTAIDWDKLWLGYKTRKDDELFLERLEKMGWFLLGVVVTWLVLLKVNFF